MSMEILDCTLRDGGYINNWRFGRETIAAILEKLDQAGIDIIECGFLTREGGDRDCSLFSSLEAVEAVLPRQRRARYVAMIAMGEKELEPSALPDNDGRVLQGVRLTFHKAEADKAFCWAKELMAKGYPVYLQPVGTVSYSDLELLHLVEKVNVLEPYAFYIVDTLGSMYRNQVTRRFHLLDENMAPGIRLGFHGHNNLQLAFSNAQVLGQIQTKRQLLLDSSVYGMGRGAGNLPTELIARYIDQNIASRYDVSLVMDVYDQHIADIRKKHQWGYSMAYHIAAVHVCHPNYASFLLEKRDLPVKDMEEVLQSIPENRRAVYDPDLIRRLYHQFQERQIDDSQTVERLARVLRQRRLLLLGGGESLAEKRREIGGLHPEGAALCGVGEFLGRRLSHRRLLCQQPPLPGGHPAAAGWGPGSAPGHPHLQPAGGGGGSVRGLRQLLKRRRRRGRRPGADAPAAAEALRGQPGVSGGLRRGAGRDGVPPGLRLRIGGGAGGPAGPAAAYP